MANYVYQVAEVLDNGVLNRIQIFGSKKRAMLEIEQRQNRCDVVEGSQKNYENWVNPEIQIYEYEFEGTEWCDTANKTIPTGRFGKVKLSFQKFEIL